MNRRTRRTARWPLFLLSSAALLPHCKAGKADKSKSPECVAAKAAGAEREQERQAVIASGGDVVFRAAQGCHGSSSPACKLILDPDRLPMTMATPALEQFATELEAHLESNGVRAYATWVRSAVKANQALDEAGVKSVTSCF